MSSQGNSGFNNGLVVGMAIGSILVLLFTTKKGRQILNILSQEGLDKVKNWENVLETLQKNDLTKDNENFNSDIDEEGEDYAVLTNIKNPDSKNGLNGDSNNTPQRVKSTTRRFFRGAPKR